MIVLILAGVLVYNNSVKQVFKRVIESITVPLASAPVLDVPNTIVIETSGAATPQFTTSAA